MVSNREEQISDREQSQLSLNMDTVGLVRALVRFDPIETAMKIRSISDARNLVELILCVC